MSATAQFFMHVAFAVLPFSLRPSDRFSCMQTIMGAVWVMGLFEGVKGLNYKLVAKVWLGWVLTLVVAAFLSAGITSLLLYSPQKTATDDIATLTRGLGADSLAMIRQLNNTTPRPSNLMVRPPFQQGEFEHLLGCGRWGDQSMLFCISIKSWFQ